MPTLLIRFPARRYHATPWGHHVNEGLIEWPPSLWRLLRALLSTGYTAGLWDENGPPPVARSLIEKLAGEFPGYRLPNAAGAHSRHYMPVGSLKKGQEDRTLVFDTWARVDKGVLAVNWNVELNTREAEMLAALVERMNYLGRSESWIEAHLLQPDEQLPVIDCVPTDAPPPLGWEQVTLMAVQTPNAYLQWRKAMVESALATLPAGDSSKQKPSKKFLKQREKAVEPYPPDIIACLQKDTAWLRKHGWSQPPGSRRVFYLRRTDALEAGAPRFLPTEATAEPAKTMLLSISTVSGNLHALPPLSRTLPQAEILHAALVYHATKNNGGTCSALTGCDDSGQPLAGPHDHSHILPLDLDGDGHLDHILIWCPAGLDGRAQVAVRAVRRTYTKGGIEPMRVALAGAGGMAELRRLPGVQGENLRAILGPEQGAKKWVSLTPFVAPRYLKKNGRNTLAGQVAAELASRGLPGPAEIQVLEPRGRPDLLRHRHFIRKRRNGPKPPVDCGYSLELLFNKQIMGPLCLGYGSHFGLGLFVAVALNED